MRRRDFIAGLGGASAMPFSARAQQKAMPRIGYLTVGVAESQLDRAALEGLRDYGYIDGQNIVIDFRSAAGQTARLAEFAAALVAAKVDVIVAAGSQVTTAVRPLTRTIPVVFTSTNPVGLGFVASLARPDGNLTGVSLFGPEVSGKRLELLRELLPEAGKIAVLWDSHDPGAKYSLEETQAIAAGIKIEVEPLDVNTADAFEETMHVASRDNCQAVLVLPAPLFSRNTPRLAEAAIGRRLPSLFWSEDAVRAGGLIAYGPNLIALYRRTAYYVDRILKGAKPADLPVEQPTKFDLTINLKTAKSLGVMIPPGLLARADEVIE